MEQKVWWGKNAHQQFTNMTMFDMVTLTIKNLLIMKNEWTKVLSSWMNRMTKLTNVRGDHIKKKGNYIWSPAFKPLHLLREGKEIITCKALSLLPSTSVNISITLYTATLQTPPTLLSYCTISKIQIKKLPINQSCHKCARGYSSRDKSIKRLSYS